MVIVYANGKEVAYFSTKIFFHSILSIFFSSIEILSKENIPEHGPIIFTGNHMNQFVDGAMMLVTNPHQVEVYKSVTMLFALQHLTNKFIIRSGFLLQRVAIKSA